MELRDVDSFEQAMKARHCRVLAFTPEVIRPSPELDANPVIACGDDYPDFPAIGHEEFYVSHSSVEEDSGCGPKAPHRGAGRKTVPMMNQRGVAAKLRVISMATA
jgi:hypothetical protein